MLIVVLNIIFVTIIGSFYHNCTFLHNKTKNFTFTDHVTILCPVTLFTIYGPKHYCRASSTIVFRAKVGGWERGGAVVRGKRSPRLQNQMLQRSRAPRLGPASKSGVQGETVALVSPITPKAEFLQIENNRIISVLPYQGYTVTQTQVNRM